MPRTRRQPRDWTTVEAAMNRLLAEVKADDDMGRRICEAWLRGRAATERADAWWQDVTTDGASLFIDSDCIATWEPGPRRLLDPDVALVGERRFPTGSFDIRARYGALAVLEERGIPTVRVRPPYAHEWSYTPEQLVHGWEASQ
jgi:hypothetical protein